MTADYARTHSKEGHRADAHHPDAVAHLARRRRHRPAVVLQRHGGLRRLGGDQQVRLHRHQPHVHRRLLHQVLGAGAGRARSTRSSTRSSARRCDARRRAGHRDRQHGRHPGRHRARLVGHVHRRPAARALRLQARARHRRRARRGGLPHRDRRARRAGRQAGPVHRRVRRAHVLRVPPRRHGARRRRWRSRRRRSTTSRSTCCCSSPGTRATAASILDDQKQRSEHGDEAMLDNLDCIERARPRRSPRRSRRGDTAAFADLMHEHWEPSGSARAACPTTRSTTGTSSAWPTARSAASSWGPAPAASCCSTPTTGALRAGDGEAGPRGGALRVRPRRLDRHRPRLTAAVRRSWPAGWARGCGRLPRRARRRSLPVAGRAVRRPPAAAGWPRQGVADVVYCIGHLGDRSRDVRRRRRPLRPAVATSTRATELRGTGGALRARARRRRARRALLVLYGDSYLPSTWRRSGRRSSTGRPARTHDRASATTDRWDAQQRRLRRRRGRPLREGRPEPRAGMRYIDYGLSYFTRDVIGREVAGRQRRRPR